MGVAAVGFALALDALFAEPPERVHPVALFGRVVAPLDRHWERPHLVGGLVATGLPLVAAATGWGIVSLATAVDPILAVTVAALALFSTTSLRALLDAAATVTALSETDVEGARDASIALVGRNTADLSASEIRSAAVESAAENLADGLVAPLLGFALGAHVSLPLAVAAAFWVKAVNTLDSMLGYPSKPVGRSSARLDDAVMWLPARLAAVLLALAGGMPGAIGSARAWSQRPASPNSGWPMATLAAVLDVTLTKPGRYVLNPGAGLPSVEDAERSIRVVRVAGVLAFVVTGVVVWL